MKYQGIAIPEKFGKANWSGLFISWVEDEAKKDTLLQDVLLLMLGQIKQLKQLKLNIEKKLRAMMNSEKYKKRSALLISVPGVGSVISALFLLEIGDIKRFPSFDQLNNYVGFCPDTNSSGESEHDTNIT